MEGLQQYEQAIAAYNRQVTDYSKRVAEYEKQLYKKCQHRLARSVGAWVAAGSRASARLRRSADGVNSPGVKLQMRSGASPPPRQYRDMVPGTIVSFPGCAACPDVKQRLPTRLFPLHPLPKEMGFIGFVLPVVHQR